MAGKAVVQAGIAREQRGAKRQPGGGRIRFGTAPPSPFNEPRREWRFGIAAISAVV